jgi:serine/threonine protein phosphatase PrpC
MTDRVKKYLYEIDKTDANFNSQQLSQLLVNGAYQDRSQDNLTAMIIPIDVAATLPIIAMVADGHGGDEISEALRQEFIAKVIELAQR